VLDIYRSNGWSAAGKPDQLMAALSGSHALVTAWQGQRLVGLGNALSDGHLVVYFPHLLVHADLHRRGIGGAILRCLVARYQGFHQQVLIADPGTGSFYERAGFRRAGSTEAMWIYAGGDG
jgi:GNAT superfamily N-acetyltransferase